MPRVHVGLLGLLAWWCLAASYATPNFVVEAPTPAIAQQVAQFAERYRREKALQWLGQEMPTWGKPCPVRVTLTLGGSGGGATSFAFDRGAILHQEMHIEGPLDRILYTCPAPRKLPIPCLPITSVRRCRAGLTRAFRSLGRRAGASPPRHVGAAIAGRGTGFPFALFVQPQRVSQLGQ